MTYGELRQLVFLRSKEFSQKVYEQFGIDLQEEVNKQKIDYSIMEVLDVFGYFIKYPIMVDNLIQTHQYTTDIWKNGSKYLYFYTLHNQEHAVDMIKNIIKITKAIDYFQISRTDYYILFIACYLHDMSMVKIPTEDAFVMNREKADQIGIEYIEDPERTEEDIYKIKNLLIKFYKKIDEFYENVIRENHAKESAGEIRTRKDLDFLDDSLKEMIAEVAESHGQRVEDVYNIRSNASEKLVSIKFDKILLRLADLLDMSSYRVSKLILNHNLEQMSQKSAFHWISHLLTKGYELNTAYCLENEKDPLAPGSIKESIEVHIKIAMSQLSKIENGKKCSSGAFEEKSLSLDGFTINCGTKCISEECNFLCKWFCEKNEYLLKELDALTEYLGNRVQNNYYKTEVKIILHIVDKTQLDSQQFEILEKELSEKV